MLTMAQTIRQFWQDLEELIGAGVPLIESLRIILNTINPINPFYQVLNRIIANIDSGLSFSQALEKNKSFFGPMEIALVQVGEKTDALLDAIANINEAVLLVKANEYKNFYAALGLALSNCTPLLSALWAAKFYCSEQLFETVHNLYWKIHNSQQEDSIPIIAWDDELVGSDLFCPGEALLLELGERNGQLSETCLRLAELC